MSVLPAPVALTLLFQFTWLGLVWQTVMTRRPPRPLQAVSALVVVFGTVFASGVYKTGIAGYDPVALLCALGAAVSCSLFVTLSGRVEAPCSSEQRGVIVCAGSVVMSLTVCPDYVVSGVLAQGILLFAVIAGFLGLLCPVLLFGMGSPHLPAGLSTVMAAAELPAGLLVAMIVLGEPLGVVEWLGVAIILAGVCLAQVSPPARRPPAKGRLADGSFRGGGGADGGEETLCRLRDPDEALHVDAILLADRRKQHVPRGHARNVPYRADQAEGDEPPEAESHRGVDDRQHRHGCRGHQIQDGGDIPPVEDVEHPASDLVPWTVRLVYFLHLPVTGSFPSETLMRRVFFLPVFSIDPMPDNELLPDIVCPFPSRLYGKEDRHSRHLLSSV